MTATAPRVLTLNAGSSSLKWAIFAGATRVAGGGIDRLGCGAANLGAALARVLDGLGSQELSRLQAVGHRVVHGGTRYTQSCRVSPQLLGDLRLLSPLDPDHLPAELTIIADVGRLCPNLPQVACFDTAFFADLPRLARLLPIPRRFIDDGVRRYGFHGLSCTFLMDALRRVDRVAATGRVVLAHLGSGASLAAVSEGRCVDTTMGFTPNSGILMGTRSGDVEPGVLLHLLRNGMSVGELDDLVNHQSGLLGVSGTSSDMRDLLAAEAHDPHAAEAIGLFCYQAARAVGALATTLGGLDTLIFAGGVGERAPAIRVRIAERLAHLGVEVDPDRNEVSAAVISTGRCVVRVIHTDEESVIARQTIATLAQGTSI